MPDNSILSCWTCDSPDSQPTLRRVPAQGKTPEAIEVVLIVGVWTPLQVDPELTLSAQRFAGDDEAPTWEEVDHEQCTRLTFDVLDRKAAQAVREAEAAGGSAEPARLEAQRNLVDVRHGLAVPGNRYYEFKLAGLPYGQLLRFIATASIGPLGRSVEARGALWLVAPEFHGDDLCCSRTTRRPASGAQETLPDDQMWVLFVKPDDTQRFDHLRLDVLRSPGHADPLAGLVVTPSSGSDDLKALWEPASSPANFVSKVFDASTDSVTYSVPRAVPSVPLKAVTITTRGKTADEDEKTVTIGAEDPIFEYRPTATILIQYCIQGFNDLFGRPFTKYQPPRNYIEVTYLDEQGLYSSRPERAEDGVADGYDYALQAQEAYGVHTQWAFNGGVLTLMRMGLSDDQFRKLKGQVDRGLISPSNAGFAAHRPPYYQKETNRREIQLGERMIKDLLGRASDKTYYPDQRLYEATEDREVALYRKLHEDHQLDYLVLDRSTVASTALGMQICLFGEGHPTGGAGNYLWKEEATGLTLLLIEDQLRNELLAASADEIDRGQLHYQLRRRLMMAVGFPKREPSQIFIYGDDLDHSCGDGWFDGGTGGAPTFYTRAYLAALCWIHRHPWVRATTVGDPGFEPKNYLQPAPLRVSSAICPSVDPFGAESFDVPGKEIHFDTWYQWWAKTEAVWLGQTLKVLSDTLEQALISWPHFYRNSLYELAWMYFLACTHESFWSKQPLDDPNHDTGEWPPEDFVVAESLQQRNAWVYLNASIWAHWALGDGKGEMATYVMADGQLEQAGPLLSHVQAAKGADPYWTDPPAGQYGLHWDHDPMSNLILYNRNALVVVDRNGGRITHVFGWDGSRPVSLSGTFKAYQYFQPEAAGERAGVSCDGSRLQNTVFTPNHAYVAADVLQSCPRIGTFTDPRPNKPEPALYPDNFNEYDCEVDPDNATVKCLYSTPIGAPPPASLDEEFLAAALKQDGEARCTRTPDGRLIWHEEKTFTKTIRLTGNRLTIVYSDVAPGHVVSNEWCLDLERAVLSGSAQSKRVSADAPQSITLSSDAGASVVISCTNNCAFTAAALATDVPADNPELAEEYLTLHRVLTDDLRIICDKGGAFAYEIRLPPGPGAAG